MTTIAGLRSADIVGWTFEAANICRVCCAEAAEAVAYANAFDDPPGSAHDASDMENLKTWAEACNINVSAMDTFDSGEFPKPFEDCDEGEECDACGGSILDVFRDFAKHLV